MADHRSIYDFNAAGDGVADDTGALQDAIDTAVAGGGGRVWCGGPDKTVLISAPIILGSLVELYGGATIAGLPYSAITFGSLPTTQPCGVCPTYNNLTGITSYTSAPLGLRVSGSSLFVYAYNATDSSQLQSGNFTDTSRLWFDASYIVAE